MKRKHCPCCGDDDAVCTENKDGSQTWTCFCCGVIEVSPEQKE